MKSFLRHTVLLVASLAISACGTRPESSTPAAILTSCQGPVTVVRARAASPATFGLTLGDGDQVKTGPGAEAEIIFVAGHRERLGPEQTLKIKGQSATGEKGDAGAEGQASRNGTFDVVRNFLKLMSPEGTAAAGGLRSGEDPPALEPVAPNQTRLRTPLPTFRWRTEDPSARLRLTVYGKRQRVWQTDVGGVTTAKYPADAPALEPGVVYSWVLETADSLASPALRTPPSFFELIAPADAKMLDADLSQLDADRPGPVTYHLVRASLFFDRGLVEDAIAETESAAASDPGNAALHIILGRLYAEAGRARDAAAEMNRARE